MTQKKMNLGIPVNITKRGNMEAFVSLGKCLYLIKHNHTFTCMNVDMYPNFEHSKNSFYTINLAVISKARHAD